MAIMVVVVNGLDKQNVCDGNAHFGISADDDVKKGMRYEPSTRSLVASLI